MKDVLQIILAELRPKADTGKEWHASILNILIKGIIRVYHFKLCKGKRVNGKRNITSRYIGGKFTGQKL